MKLVKDTDQSPKKKHEVSDEKAEEAIKTIIRWIGEDSEREGLLSTPKRVIKAYKEYFKGYTEDPRKFLSKTLSKIVVTNFHQKLLFFVNLFLSNLFVKIFRTLSITINFHHRSKIVRIYSIISFVFCNLFSFTHVNQ